MPWMRWAACGMTSLWYERKWERCLVLCGTGLDTGTIAGDTDKANQAFRIS